MPNARPFDWPEQLLLFESPRARPRWENLPSQTRQEVVGLMAKMLQAYPRHQNMVGRKREDSDE